MHFTFPSVRGGDRVIDERRLGRWLFYGGRVGLFHGGGDSGKDIRASRPDESD